MTISSETGEWTETQTCGLIKVRCRVLHDGSVQISLKEANRSLAAEDAVENLRGEMRKAGGKLSIALDVNLSREVAARFADRIGFDLPTA